MSAGRTTDGQLLATSGNNAYLALKLDQQQPFAKFYNLLSSFVLCVIEIEQHLSDTNSMARTLFELFIVDDYGRRGCILQYYLWKALRQLSQRIKP